ncbi:MAG: hypothetical protein ACE5EX_12585, partial [Phycisphaerae bacterium]
MIKAPPPRPIVAPLAAAAPEAPPRTAETAAPWATLPGGVIDGGELVLLAIKPSMWRPLFESSPWLLMCAALAGALIALNRPLAGLSVTTTAQLIMIAGFIRVGLALVHWIPTWYVLTNRRVIDICGVRQPRILSLALVDVRNTYVHATASERCVRLGTITFVN